MSFEIKDKILSIIPGAFGIHLVFLSLLITKRNDLMPIDVRKAKSYNLPIVVILIFLIYSLLILLFGIVGPIFLDWFDMSVLLKPFYVSLGTALISIIWAFIKLL